MCSGQGESWGEELEMSNSEKQNKEELLQSYCLKMCKWRESVLVYKGELGR